MKIITLYANQSETNYYSCIVDHSTYETLMALSNFGGFKRFDIDYEDNTKKPATDKNDIYNYFLSKVFPKASKQDIENITGLTFNS